MCEKGFLNNLNISLMGHSTFIKVKELQDVILCPHFG